MLPLLPLLQLFQHLSPSGIIFSHHHTTPHSIKAAAS
jgi:hypothetical protein